jgi:hypothetical protein
MSSIQVRPGAITRIDSSVIATAVCLLVLAVFLRQSDQFLHWFIIPITFSGILIGIDAVDWLRQRVSLFDPIGILGVLGFHFFFLAPLLHVSLDLWLAYVTPPPDWRPWLGNMAMLNFLGLWVYRLVRSIGNPPQLRSAVAPTIWKLNWKQFPIILCSALLLSAILQIFVYAKFGGILSYIATATDVSGSGGEAFSGMGPLFMISESFPILAMIGFVAYARKRPKWQTVAVLVLVVIAFVILRLFFGGLRGSRSNTIWALFWAVGMIHFWIRPLSRKAIALGLVGLILFMYVYGFFKSGGLEGVKTAFESYESHISTNESGRSWKSLLLQDLGRSDIQAFMLYRLSQPDSDYQYALGRTYGAALTMLIPSALLPNKPPSKTQEGTDLQYGMYSYVPGLLESSKVYGLAGEAMLNFGPWAVPISFAALGLSVGLVRRWLYTWHISDTRILLLPFLVNFCFVVLISDLDNDLFFLFKQGCFPFFVILVSSKSFRLSLYPSLQNHSSFHS